MKFVSDCDTYSYILTKSLFVFLSVCLSPPPLCGGAQGPKNWAQGPKTGPEASKQLRFCWPEMGLNQGNYTHVFLCIDEDYLETYLLSLN